MNQIDFMRLIEQVGRTGGVPAAGQNPPTSQPHIHVNLADRVLALEAEVGRLRHAMLTASHGFAKTGEILGNVEVKLETLRAVGNDFYAWAVGFLDLYNERHLNSPPALYPADLPPGFALTHVPASVQVKANERIAELVKENDGLRKQYEDAARTRDDYGDEQNRMYDKIRELEARLAEATKPKPAAKPTKKPAKKKV